MAQIHSGVPQVRFDGEVRRVLLDHLHREARRVNMRTDAIDSIFLDRQLHQIQAEVYKVDYPDLKGKSLVPVSHELSPGARTFGYRMMNRVGIAEIGNIESDETPIFDVTAEEDTGRIYDLPGRYRYTVNDMLAAQFAGVPLDAMKANAAMEATEQGLDKLIALGDLPRKLYGLLSLPNANVYTIPAGASGFQAWSKKTPQEIYADMAGMLQLIRTSTIDTAQANVIVLPIAQHALIEETPWNSANASNVSILEYFKRNHPGVDVVAWTWAAGAGANGSDRMVAYKRDKSKIFCHIPMEFTQYPVQYKGLTFEIPTLAKFGGVISPYPLTNAVGDGI